MKAFLRSYGAHALAYAFSALTIVAGLPAPMQAALGPHAGQIVGVAGILLTAVHNTDAVVNKPGATAVVSSVAKAMLVAMLLPLAFAVVTLQTACTTAQIAQVQAVATSPAAQVLVTAAVDAAVATAEQKGISATQINAVAKVALTAAGSTGATVATVTAVANAKLATLNLPAGDLAAAQLLEALVGAEIQARLAADPNATTSIAAAQTDVAFVLNAIIAATGG